MTKGKPRGGWSGWVGKADGRSDGVGGSSVADLAASRVKRKRGTRGERKEKERREKERDAGREEGERKETSTYLDECRRRCGFAGRFAGEDEDVTVIEERETRS